MIFNYIGGIWGGVLGGVWGHIACIVVVFWRDLGGKNGLNKLKKKRSNKIILIFHFVVCLIGIFG